MHPTGRWPGGEAVRRRPRPAPSGVGTGPDRLRARAAIDRVSGSSNPRGKPAGGSSVAGGRCRRGTSGASGLGPHVARRVPCTVFLRKEVIQPQVPLRLPCYDLVPITDFIFGACLTAPATSDAPRFGGLTGGVYKAQEHIHRGSADPRLLAIPASCGRVAARNPNWGAVFAIGAALRLGVALSAPL